MCPLRKVIFKTLPHIFSLFPNIPENIFDDMIYLVNNDTIFTLDYGNIEEPSYYQEGLI